MCDLIHSVVYLLSFTIKNNAARNHFNYNSLNSFSWCLWGSFLVVVLLGHRVPACFILLDFGKFFSIGKIPSFWPPPAVYESACFPFLSNRVCCQILMFFSSLIGGKRISVIWRIFELCTYFVIRDVTFYASDQDAFPVKGQIVNILDFMVPTVSVTNA